MSAILKFDFQKRKQLRFSEVNYLDTQKRPNLHVTTTFSLKQGETRTSSGPIQPPLICMCTSGLFIYSLIWDTSSVTMQVASVLP